MPTLALLDGHSLAYRAFYALPDDLATKDGQITNSVYGFTRMLIKLLDDHRPDRVAVAWDTGRDTFRRQEYPEYKAQRDKAPDIFVSQLPLIDEVLTVLGIGQFRLPGYEADDIIASMATEASLQDWDVLVVTGDRDAFQLISDRVKVLYTLRGISDNVLADVEWVTSRYGIRPDQYVEYAAMRGDPSDNLPGVPGVGEKTAARLLDSYGSIEGVYDNMEELTPKLRENLAISRDQVFINRDLMRLKADLELEGSKLEELTWADWNEEAARSLFQSLEFHSVMDDLIAIHPDQPVVAHEALDTETQVIADGRRASQMLPDGPIAIEPVYHGGVLEGLAMAIDRGLAIFVPFTELSQLPLDDPARPKYIHSAKRLLRDLARAEIAFDGPALDTEVAAYLLDPSAKSFELAALAESYLGLELVSPDQESTKAGQSAFDFSGGPDLESAGKRAVALQELAPVLVARLTELGEAELLNEVEMPLVGVLARMEAVGIQIDRDYLEDLGADLRSRLRDLEGSIHESAGRAFSINSTLQLREILYQDLGLPILKKTPKGAPSTDASVLAKLVDAHPIVALLLEYRELEKLRSTYVDGYLPIIESDSRIRTTFNQVAAATGRLSSDHPNLQNIPVRSETGRTIRRAFVAGPSSRFVVADYSQIELRVLAHLSQDPALLDAFRGEEVDIHTATAARVFEVAPSGVTPEMRRRAKVINFGLLYGMEAFGLADRLEISRDEASQHIDAYFAQFPAVQTFLQSVVAEARRTGYTATLFGRKRYLPELKSDNFRIRQMGERMALNAPVQGTAADIIKKAMVDLDAALRDEPANLLLQIHDELVVETPNEHLNDTIALLTGIMENVVKLDVPLRVDVATGANLAECKE